MRATMNAATALGALVAATVLTVTAAGTAPAAPRHTTPPTFLSADELPPHPASDWYAGEVIDGLPEFPVFCLENALPEVGASHREFWTDYDTGAVQVVVVAANNGAARKLAAAAETSVRNCADDWEQRYPEGTAEWRDFGTIDVEKGAHVYGVQTSYPDAENDVHLFGVGRDGRTVTVVRWGQMGTFQHAEVGPFKETTRTAVDKLYR